MIFKFLIYLFIFLFGLSIGSFLNCVIYRLESKKSLSGRSFCPRCKHTLSWQDLFPVFSYLFLKGKCRYCRAKISIQYPIVEIITGLIFLLIFNFQFSIFNEFPIYQFLNIAFLFYIACVLIIIFIYDLKYYIIPDKVLFPAIAISLVYDFININHLLNFFLAALIASGFFLIIFLISRGRWMGFGDVKLAVLMGLLLGVLNVSLALFLAFFFGGIIGIVLMVYKKKNLKSEIPFGPFLIIGTFLAMLWGPQIINWYLKLFLI